MTKMILLEINKLKKLKVSKYWEINKLINNSMVIYKIIKEIIKYLEINYIVNVQFTGKFRLVYILGRKMVKNQRSQFISQELKNNSKLNQEKKIQNVKK